MSSVSNNKAVLLHKIEQRKLDANRLKETSFNLLEQESSHILYQKIVQAFGTKGIPALISQNILDDYQYETNIVLAKLRPDIQLQFITEKERSDKQMDDTLDIVYHMDGQELEFQQLSGAQKLIASFALKLGLASVMTRRLGVQIKLLLIDEIDQALDKGTIETLENTIKTLQQDYKILLISHNEEFQQKFKTTILVEQDENKVSTAKVI
jgi:DNA repair protein SbcC/Rad50